MKLLIAIIFFHTLILFRVQTTVKDRIPYLSIAAITIALVASVFVLLSKMEGPEL
ncbi:MAG TPA: hypothetical protein VJ941_11360 [Gracilimonas sp.]|jgi:hypothetical protein|nr:hypothetical protein [Gracilimonas sp.]